MRSKPPLADRHAMPVASATISGMSPRSHAAAIPPLAVTMYRPCGPLVTASSTASPKALNDSAR